MGRILTRYVIGTVVGMVVAGGLMTIGYHCGNAIFKE
jgi:hypothetical protein